MNGKWENLPKWAQDHLRQLEQDKRELSKRVEVLSNPGGEDSNVIVTGYSHPDVRLGKDLNIEFLLANGDKIEVSHERDRNHLLVSSPSGSLEVQPQSGNVVKVRPGGWW